MDVVENGILIGDINGVLHGGASITPGKVGSALRVNGKKQYVHYGFHLDKCYHIPDRCNAGITFAIWLKVHTAGKDIIDTGAMFRNSVGYWLKTLDDRSIYVSFKDTLTYHQYRGPAIPLGEWVHITFTWPSNGGLIHVYINGCDTDDNNGKGYAYNLARSDSIQFRSVFIVGAGDNGTSNFASGDIDEIIFWEKALNQHAVWQFYVDGGSI